MRGPATPATLAVGFVGFPLGVEAGAAMAAEGKSEGWRRQASSGLGLGSGGWREVTLLRMRFDGTTATSSTMRLLVWKSRVRRE